MAMTFALDGLNAIPEFNDPNIRTCKIDGEQFTDPAVYQQHMLMFHGLNVSVQATDGSTIKAPENPVISRPISIIYPGVELAPITSMGPEYYHAIQPQPVLGTITPVYTPSPTGTFNGQGPGPGSSSQGNGSPAAWAWVVLVGSILAFSTRKHKR